MSLPTSYLTSTKNLSGILEAMQSAQAPKTFTNSFLSGLDYKSSSDRLFIGVLKALGFLDSKGVPTQRYFDFLDQTQGAAVLAEGIREAYADLFQVNKTANELSQAEVKNKLKTLTQGKYSDSVLDKMTMTFRALCELADFESPRASKQEPEFKATESQRDGESPDVKEKPATMRSKDRRQLTLDGLVYNIQLVLPESRDPAVYEALFRSLKEHLI